MDLLIEPVYNSEADNYTVTELVPYYHDKGMRCRPEEQGYGGRHSERPDTHSTAPEGSPRVAGEEIWNSQAWACEFEQGLEVEQS